MILYTQAAAVQLWLTTSAQTTTDSISQPLMVLQGSEGGVRQSLSSPALAPESPPAPALARAASFATGDDLPHELPTGADFMDTPQSVQTLAVAPRCDLWHGEWPAAWRCQQTCATAKERADAAK